MTDSLPILSDSFGRKHDYLRISLTDRCNLRCFYCMPEEGIELTEKSHLMTIEEIVEMAKIFVSLGIKKIRLTGGEPLIRKNIELLFRELSKLPVELALTSNGILVDKYLELFKETGLKKLNISLDSLHKEKALFITKRDYFDRIMANIELLLSENFDLKINVVLMKGVNDNELIDFIEWTKNKKLSLRFIEFMPFNGNNWDRSKTVGLGEILQTLKTTYGEKLIKIADSANDTSLNYKINGFEGSFGIISTVTNPFCSTCNRIRLTANGRIKNCLFSNGETDLLTPLRNGVNIEPLIRQNILDKKAQRAGMDSDEKFNNADLNSQNRSMIAIGG